MGAFLRFSHSRKKNIGEICDDLNHVITDFTYKDQNASFFIDRFSKRHNIPKGIVQKQMLIYLEGSYHYQRSKFQDNLFVKQVFTYAFKEVAFLALCLFRSKSVKARHKCIIALDLVENEKELDRFKNVLNQFSKESIAVISKAPYLLHSEYETIDQGNYRNYARELVASAFLKEIFNAIPVLILLSLKARVNFLAFNLSFLNQVFYYRSIIKKVEVKIVGQDRHYSPGAIKKHILNSEAKAKLFSVQKNIYQTGRNGFNYLYDIVFSIGNKTLGDFSKYNGRIGEVVPVGSMYMDSLFWKKRPGAESCEKFDIVFVGINTAQAMFYLDCYESFVDDYYKSFEWLVKFKKNFSKYKIGVKHHASLRVRDEREERILNGSGIISIDKNIDSYSLCFKAESIVTFGSTMGFEFVGHRKPVVFVDPDYNCAFFPSDSSFCKTIRASNYNDFERMLLRSLERGLDNTINPSDFCMESDGASLEIAQKLKESIE